MKDSTSLTDLPSLKKAELFSFAFIAAERWAHADFKMCLMPRTGITTQPGRLFNS
ncbi:MAG: hypothetical protein Udaeo2_00350 [Candidatus Udaeobacter sp.]|nr:MAG: hypothetical protein Udaeo2_00350 [Candidatus Udaeobacter sp.]